MRVQGSGMQMPGEKRGIGHSTGSTLLDSDEVMNETRTLEDVQAGGFLDS
jgi:hypothetical protein